MRKIVMLIKLQALLERLKVNESFWNISDAILMDLPNPKTITNGYALFGIYRDIIKKL